MMIRSIPTHCSSAASFASLFSNNDARRVICCSSRSNDYIPKLEPFSRTKLDRAFKDPPLIQKSENDIADYCSTLEGDDSYSCWKAYFELKDLERESPKAEVEKLILQVGGGVKSLIDFIHGVASIHRAKKEGVLPEQEGAVMAKRGEDRPFPMPDGLPKTAEEMEDEERARMPDSPYTRLLRNKGRFPVWYSPAPDHETD